MLRESFQGEDKSTFDERQEMWIVRIPKDFSFISNPNDTLDALASILAVSRKQPRSLFLDHSQCKNMDLGASIVLDVIMMNLRQEWKINGKYTLAGRLPEPPSPVRDVIMCMGVTKHLNIPEARPTLEVDSQFHKFELFRGRRQSKDRITGGSDQERAATALTQYLDTCFQMAADYTFSNEGKRLVLSWAGEIITNAEEHSNESEWFAIAYMAPTIAHDAKNTVEERSLSECQLAIFNFGRSIYESLSAPETPQGTRDAIQQLVEKHTQKSFFGFSRYSPPDLWTLYAMQDGVTRFADVPGELSRGKGTIKMINAFQLLGETENTDRHPEMALVSGTSRILFTTQYRLQKTPVASGVRNLITFNDSHSLEDRPDSNNVHSLDGKFPGTLLTFKFFIDKRYLDARVHTTAATNPNESNKA